MSLACSGLMFSSGKIKSTDEQENVESCVTLMKGTDTEMESKTLYPRKRQSNNPGIDVGASDYLNEPLASLTPSPLSPLARLYVYALHGCLCEVAFTATWNWYYTHDQKLPGYTSLWSLLIYSLAIFLMEGLSTWLQQRHFHLLLRLTVYTLFIYLWEFSWGVLLRLLEACPWDYSHFKYNLMGLVTLEYAMPWAMAALLAEKHVIRYTLKIRVNT
ncbi:transmembrane protein 229b-like [Tachysurus fulvidraco]|uniref:transmembrane protein 229b-like n=1 Tax=Tachysurus fulvidraco TaxID=1234273 RepID=UPI001FED9A9D|nr:transmembrane protein 229b-like [Tachysurus fulvidraco]